jgi:hypothetical protein
MLINIFGKDDVVVDTDISNVKIQKRIRKFLNDYFQSTCFKDLKFESTFSNDDRHQIANNIRDSKYWH